MANVYFSQDDLTNATNVIIEYLRDTGYEGSVEAGTGISDTVIKPNALLYALFSQLVDRARAYLSLQQATNMYNAAQLSEDDYNDAVDSILSNWFVTRKDGQPTYGTIRIWVSQPLEFVQFVGGASVGTCGSIPVVANGDQVFVESDFSRIVNATNTYNEYYIDVAVRSAENTDVLITAGSEATATLSDIYYLRASVPSTFVPGISRETTTVFIERTRMAITTRELITDRAIDTVLREEFDSILSLYVAGHGDKEQMRDIVTLENGVRVHYGNKADIYIASQLQRMTQEMIVGEDGTLPVAELPANAHIGHILSCYTLGEPDEEGIVPQIDVPITGISVEETSWGMSGYKPAVIKVDAPAGTTVTLEWLSDPALTSIQEFVYSEDQRVACYDPQTKHKFPVVLNFDITVQLINEDDVSRREVVNAVNEYIIGLASSGDAYRESELISYIHGQVSNVRRVDVPITCTATLFDPASGAYKTAPVTNIFSLAEFGGLSQQVSENTVQLYTDAALVNVH